MSSNDVIKVGHLEIRYLVDGSESDGLGVFELTVPPGANVPPPHSHRHNEEFFYVVEGSIGYSVDGDARELGPGEWMSTPRGSVHAFRNTGTQTARALVVLTPDIGAQYFRDVAEVVNAGGPPDRAKLLEVMSRYGLVAAAPPPAAASAPRTGA
jgi:quercetin dioxygenase-like cupin family protein